MDIKEAFQVVKKHLLCQGSKAQNDDGSCCYKSKDGKKCAIGILIPAEVYTKNLEFYGPDYLANLLRIPMDFLCAIRSIHDHCDVSEWPSQLDRLERTL